MNGHERVWSFMYAKGCELSSNVNLQRFLTKSATNMVTGFCSGWCRQDYYRPGESTDALMLAQIQSLSGRLPS